MAHKIPGTLASSRHVRRDAFADFTAARIRTPPVDMRVWSWGNRLAQGAIRP